MVIELWILIIILGLGLIVGFFLIIKEKQESRNKQQEIRIKERKKGGNLRDLDIRQERALSIKSELEELVIGQPELVHGLIVGLFSGKHVLIQSLPGMAKTMAVKALAQSTGLQFGRIQGTPDLLPSDIIGLEKLEGEIQKGPLFANIILFDEINRTTPKVQSACIQAMEEGQVTIGHQTLDLPQPFIVFATSNPLGSKGVYELPEAQLDRFGLSIYLDYPENEREILRDSKSKIQNPKGIIGVSDGVDFEFVRKEIEQVQVGDEIIDYITGIIQKTRVLPEFIKVGASPRSGKDLLWLAKTLARLEGKKSVSTGEVMSLIDCVLGHRIVREKSAKMQNVCLSDLI